MPAFDPSMLDDERLRRFHRHWESLRGGFALPDPAAIDPLDVPWALGWLSIIEREGGAYRWRLDGSRLAEFFRVEMTGKTLDQYPYAAAIPGLRADFDGAVATRAPVFSKRRYIDERGPWAYRALIAPAGADRATPDTLFQILALDPD
jgi:hypothetical protein